MIILPRMALILARISDAELVITSEGARELDVEGVESQVADLLDLAASLSWGVGPEGTHRITENDVSAFRVRMVTLPVGEPWGGRRERRPKRPEYWRALQMLWTGEADGVLTVNLDRTARHPRDLEDLIDVVELRGIPVVDLAGEIDLSTNSGRAEARNTVARANAASADTSRRVARKLPRYARNGRYLGGPRRFGFEARGPEKGRYLVTVPQEAAEIRHMADQVLSGVSLRQVALDLRARGVKTSKGAQWSAVSVRTLLLNPAIAGLLTYRPAHPAGVPQTAASRLYTEDQIIGRAPWDEIITEPEYWAVRELLTDPSRRTSPGNTPRHLLTMLATCHCGGPVCMVRNHKGEPTYRCKECAGPRRLVSLADRWVALRVTRRLMRPDAADLLPRPELDVTRRDLERELAALKTRKAAQARMHALGQIDDDDLREGSAALRDAAEAVERRLAPLRERSPLEGIAGNPDAMAIYKTMPLGLRRELLRVVCESIVFMPAASGPGFDPSSIVVTMRS